MTPYYQDESVTLYCGDCREVLPKLDPAADLVLADPPYGETAIAWDRWPSGWIDALGDKVKPSASFWCFGSMRMFLEQADEFCSTFMPPAWRFVQEVIWEKHNGSGFHVDRFRRVHEIACHYVRDGVRWDDVYKCPQFTHDAKRRTVRKQAKPAHWHGATGATTYTSTEGGPRRMRSVLHVRSMHGMATHPTEKPVGILAPLIDYSCPPGGIVLVPFAGSGAELDAARSAGRRAVGIEINEGYCRSAVQRLKQGVLFTAGGVA